MQSTKEIMIHEIDLSEFGKTPKGDPLFRVVWAPTRTEKVLIKGRDKVVELKRYPNEECWLLEKWKSAYDWAGTREGHRNMCFGAPIAMEYPEDGEYERCDVSFPDGDAVKGFAALYVQYLVMGTVNYTEKDRLKALKLREQMKEQDIDEKTSDAINDVLSAPTWAGQRVKLYDAAGNIIH
jgi:hypothetical protein